MSEMPVSAAREHLAEVIASTSRSGEPVYLTEHGRPVAVVVDPAAFERLCQGAEDALDRAELAIVRADDDFIPWAQVKAELGRGRSIQSRAFASALGHQMRLPMS